MTPFLQNYNKNLLVFLHKKVLTVFPFLLKRKKYQNLDGLSVGKLFTDEMSNENNDKEFSLVNEFHVGGSSSPRKGGHRLHLSPNVALLLIREILNVREIRRVGFSLVFCCHRFLNHLT